MMKSKIKFLLTLGFILHTFIHSAYGQSGVVFTSLYSFTGGNDGAIPTAALVQGSDGDFYGTTFNGGTNGAGTVFKISTNGVLTSLYSFNGSDTISNDGVNPQAGLVQGNGGYFYGTTSLGGANSAGTVFKISTNGALTSYLFAGGDDGSEPDAGLVQGNDGNFYGTTVLGGTNGAGTVFKIGTNMVLTSLYSFTGGNDGSAPFAGLVQGGDGDFYGATSAGGTNGAGTVFKISTNGTLTSLYSFGGNDGYGPYVGLVQGSDGYFYGTTPSGGTNDYGTVFKISTNGALTTLYSFTGAHDGAQPEAVLVQGSDGDFYGTTFHGGTNGAGTVFKITTNGVLTSLYTFAGSRNGPYPNGLVLGSDAAFYGTTGTGGTNNMGSVFRLAIAPQLAMSVSGAFVTLSWPTNYAGWYLQRTVNLGAAGFVRITLQAPPVIVNGQFVVTLPITNPQQGYYRLSSP
jgi:uncharacterized repeat protein (TIGR03803 family)